MIKGTFPNEATFRELFSKQFFSEDKQWGTFIKCTETVKNQLTVTSKNISIIGWMNFNTLTRQK